MRPPTINLRRIRSGHTSALPQKSALPGMDQHAPPPVDFHGDNEPGLTLLPIEPSREESQLLAELEVACATRIPEWAELYTVAMQQQVVRSSCIVRLTATEDFPLAYALHYTLPDLRRAVYERFKLFGFIPLWKTRKVARYETIAGGRKHVLW